jgi:C4-dicarboxylate-specific signal transduction histidine kinase
MLIKPLVPLSHLLPDLFYTRHEIAKRISFFYMVGFVANAFSGLIAYSVFQWHRSLYVVLLSLKLVELEANNHRIGNISSLLKAAGPFFWTSCPSFFYHAVSKDPHTSLKLKNVVQSYGYKQNQRLKEINSRRRQR